MFVSRLPLLALLVSCGAGDDAVLAGVAGSWAAAPLRLREAVEPRTRSTVRVILRIVPYEVGVPLCQVDWLKEKEKKA